VGAVQPAGSVEYASAVAELDAFVVHWLGKTPAGQRITLRERLYVAAAALAINAFTLTGPLLEKLLLAPGLALAAFLICPSLHRRFAIARMRRTHRTGKNVGVLGWHRLSLLDAELREESEAGSQNTRYDVIFKVDETETHAFIYTTVAQAYIVPKGAVSAGDLQSFLEELKRRVDAA
jgi:hypothetical protein